MWAHYPNDVTLNAYKVTFICDKEVENYSSFILLVEAALEDDVAHSEIELFLIPDKLVKCSVSPYGKAAKLSADQVKKAKLFQEFFFNGLFGKLFTGSRKSEVKREFLFKEGNMISWSSENMYLLLPFEPSSFASFDSLSIHWKGIDACSAAAGNLQNIFTPHGETFTGNLSNFPYSSVDTSNLHAEDHEKSEMIHFANKSLYIKNISDAVVLAIHTGRIYSVLGVINNTTPESSFEEISDTKQSGFTSFIDYYQQKYDIVLKHPRQPLLLLKQSHNPHNLLFSKSKYLADDSTGQQMLEKEQIHARIPPELLVHIDISIDILKSFYLLPSVMHRLESLMLACQLRDEIGYSHGITRVPSLLILEAITTSRCCEKFSLERLELLGDSVLKYALSCHLFLKYPTKHEGQLSDHRSQAVCNSTLHKLGTGRSLQGYIRDGTFDPRRWVAPGQITLRPVPCNCGLDVREVPLQRDYMTEATSVVVGKACDKGHRWICSKTIADCVEALIGAYYVTGGLAGAFLIMNWFGLGVEFDPALLNEAKVKASLRDYLHVADEVESLESKLGYKFSVKGLILEAITHPSQQELGIGYCYQRLEFLGDSALDLLITRHLYMNYTELDPGELTDLRSALVSNENFAKAAVRGSLHHHLQYSSGILLEQLEKYAKSILEYSDNEEAQGVHKGPKVLGDIVESIAAAILIDADFNINMVWSVFEPLLSPIVTPDKLPLPPFRELIELCNYLGYSVNAKCTNRGDEVVAELAVQLENELLVEEGIHKNKKAAKANAAFSLLKDLKKRGMLHYHHASNRNQSVDKSVDISSHFSLSPKESTVNHNFMDQSHAGDDHSYKMASSELKGPVEMMVRMQKGECRSALFHLCKLLQWPMPKFVQTEEKFRTPIILQGEKTSHFSTFTSNITLHIPNNTVIRLLGDPKTNKKSSQDSAALAMLQELERQGRCILTMQ